ncbi:sugar 3,4-ketoisomerase [Saccharospirillum alexandrii]|uniref:sugar 3,4-ketoisomerase n=1 Tax=Saccharospirillum alexandrii TaxID=2448477 RepID=UPI000FD9808B|nr:FdtA/QdtA family cupin domain-containing protein [Saccharospirillum alexandrii]
MKIENVELVRWFDFPSLGDDRGSLVALEGSKTIPFDIKRVYYIFGTRSDVSRGFHAHKALKQIAICITGQCKMLLDNGIEKQEVWLNSPTRGLYIDDMIWREMHEFSSDCVLLVLASEHYCESDYIRDYKVFSKLKGLPYEA